MKRLPFAILHLLGLAACDAAKADYERCTALKAQHELAAAERACSAAVEASESSRYGKRAAAKLAVIKRERAQKAARAAEAKAERARLLDGEQAGSSRLPPTEQQIADWRLLVSKHPKSAEAAEATRRLEQLSSVCRQYAGAIPYKLGDHLTRFEKITTGFDPAFSAWTVADGSAKLVALAKSTQDAIDVERNLLRAVCGAIVEHPERPGETEVKLSLLKDCMKLNAHAARLQELFDVATGHEAFVVRYMMQKQELDERGKLIAHSLQASEWRRVAQCKTLLEEDVNAPPAAEAPAAPEQAEHAADTVPVVASSEE